MSASHPLSGYEDGVYAERDRLRAINAAMESAGVSIAADNVRLRAINAELLAALDGIQEAYEDNDMFTVGQIVRTARAKAKGE